MGCGKSKHDVASGNTILQSKKSSVNSKENETETKDKNNNNVDNQNPRVQMEQIDIESVKEFGDVAKADEGNNEKTNVQEESSKVMVQAEKNEGEKDDDSLKENDDKKVNDADTAEEKKSAENEKEEVTVEEETLAKEEEEDIKDISVSNPEREEKDLKGEVCRVNESSLISYSSTR